MRLLLVILCSAYAAVPPGVCVCAVERKHHEGVNDLTPPPPRSCCRHAHRGPPAVPALEPHPPAHREPADDHPQHCQVCERLPATVTPVGERVEYPDVAGIAVLMPLVTPSPALAHAERSPADPPDLSPRLRLHLLCALRM